MGRPREHDGRTRTALLAAAERLIADHGLDELSLRTVADEAGTTTRAVYSLFGSKDGLAVAVATQAFADLADRVGRHKETKDPAADLIAMGAGVYRRFVRERPSLFRLTFQRIAPSLPLGPEFFEARANAWTMLEAKVKRVQDAGLLGKYSVTDAAVAFNALCEGLANAELRGGTMARDQDRIWHDAFSALVRGLAAGRTRTKPASSRKSR